MYSPNVLWRPLNFNCARRPVESTFRNLFCAVMAANEKWRVEKLAALLSVKYFVFFAKCNGVQFRITT
jgi:hypothetical protein